MPVRIADSADVSPHARIGDGLLHLAPRPGPRGRRRSARTASSAAAPTSAPACASATTSRSRTTPWSTSRRRSRTARSSAPPRSSPTTTSRASVNPDGSLKSGHDWEPVGVTVREGASIGARAVCVAPVTIGRWALVAAGATVVRDVPDFALVVGVPARRIGWVGRAGVPLEQAADDARPLGRARRRAPSTGK